MKKVFLIALGGLLLVGCGQRKSADAAEETEAAATDSVAAGGFEVKDLDGCKLHIYLTGDQMGDASYIVEGTDSLVTLEQPLFKANAAEYDAYLAKLGKPVAHRIADFHLGNTGDAPLLVPEGMAAGFTSPQYTGMMSHFAEEYGDAIEPMPTGTMAELPFGKEVTLGGVAFKLLKGASNDFAGANILIGNGAVYSHWAPAKSHINTLYAGDMEGVEARLAELKEILATGATTFVGGHGDPATAEDVSFRIGYLEKIKELRGTQKDAPAFAAALIEAYPGLPGEESVGSLAEALY